MKVGFGAGKQKKKKGNKNGKKGKKAQKRDAAMSDAADVEQQQEAAAADAGGGAQPATAKEKQRNRMALKQTLKVKVAGLKAHRNKLTKLAGNKDARRALNKEMRTLVKEQLGIKNAGAGGGGGAGAGGKQRRKQQQAAADAGDAMAE